MREILDLQGGSGATYRFRRWSGDQPHQPIAGNYVVAAVKDGPAEVLLVGETNDLGQAVAEVARRLAAGAHLFTRLNISRRAREAEHADLLAAFPAAKAERAST